MILWGVSFLIWTFRLISYIFPLFCYFDDTPTSTFLTSYFISFILPTDLSKAFDCLPPDLFVAKLFAYGFDDQALRFIYDYLWHRKQRTKIVDSYSSWQEILYDVPQRSILGPLLFNADLCDLFIIMNRYDIANYADDNTPYVSGRNIEEVVASLETADLVTFTGEILNGKLHFLCSGMLINN